MDVNVSEVVSKLSDAVKADPAIVESSATEKETVATEAAKTESGKKGTAQDRIQELVAEREAFKAKLSEAENKLTQKDGEIHSLIDSVKQREAAARVVDKINALHSQGKFKAEIEAIDAAIRGVEQDASAIAAAADTTPKVPASGDLLKLQQDAARDREEALNAIAAQKNELLLMKSQLVVEKLFGNLPEAEYNDQDRKVLQNALVDHVDWEAIENDPNALEAEVAKGFQSTVSWYGDPRGKLSQTKTTQVTDESGKTKAPEPVDYTKLELGKLVVSGKDREGKETYRPAITDNEFQALLADELKRSAPKR